MSRPESRRPAGWGHSMAGSIAINIYSVSRVVEESTGLEPRHTQPQHTCTNSLDCCYSLLPLRPLFPPNAITTQADRLGPWTVVVWPHSFLCQRARALTTVRLLIETNIKLRPVNFNHIKMSQLKCQGNRLILPLCSKLNLCHYDSS